MGLVVKSFSYNQNTVDNSLNRSSLGIRPLENIDDNNKLSKDSKVIRANQLNFAGDNQTMKRISMRREALKGIVDTFADDLVMDETLHGMGVSAGELQKKAEGAYAQKDRIENLKAQLKESMGVDDDSDEQKDLELIEKKRQLTKTGNLDSLTSQEKERLANMGPLTDYQKMALEYDDISNYWNDIAVLAMEGKKSLGTGADMMKVEMSKNHEMVNAGKTADDIMDALSKDIISSDISQTLENINDRLTVDDKKDADEVNKSDNSDTTDKQHNSSSATDSTQNASGMEDEIKGLISEENAQAIRKATNNMLANKLMTEFDIKGISLDELI